MKRICHLLLAASLAMVAGCNRTPQISGDRECLAAADALWTAVTSKRPELLARSSEEIEELHAAARMPDAAFERLSGIVTTARAGQWTDAQAALKTFVRGQRPPAK